MSAAVAARWGRRLALIVVGLGALWLVVGASGSSESGLRLGDVSAWLVSEPTGEATLADGSTVDVVVSKSVAEPASPMRSVQAGPSAYVIDEEAGAIVYLDGATFETSTPTRFAKGSGEALDVFVDAEDPTIVYVVDSEGGEISRVEPETLGVLDRVSFGGTASSGAVSDGVLWVTDESSGTVRRVGAGDSSETSVGSAGDELALVLVESGPAVVNRATRTVSVLDSNGGISEESCFDVRPDVVAHVSGSSGTWVLGSVSEQGNLMIADVYGNTCLVADVAPEATDLGAPVEEGGSVFVADHNTGEVVIIDPETGEEIARTRELVEAGTAFELFADDGFVWFNDPGSETAGVVNADGTDSAFDKYDPDAEDDDAPGVQEESENDDPPPDPELACGTFPPGTGQVDTEIAFEAQASDDLIVDRYVWDFGDGTQPAVGRRATHTFTEVGAQEVTVTAELAGGRTTTAPCPFETSEDPVELAAAFTAPDVGVVGEPVDIVDASIGATEWVWFFQGSNPEEVEGPEPAPVTWDSPGIYSLSLRIGDDAGNIDATSQSIEIIEPSGDPLDVAFDVSDDTPTRGETVEFTSTSTGDITGWTWSFGDGTAGTGETTSHEYTDGGEYTATLTIEDLDGDTVSASKTIDVGFAPVTAIAAADASAVDSATAVNFTDQSIGDVDSVAWDFDSNGTVDSTEPNPSHTYGTPGVYPVALTVTGKAGDTSTDATLTVTVSQAVAFVGDYSGQAIGSATSQLAALGFSDFPELPTCSTTGAPIGTVITNTPSNQDHPLNAPIDFRVSDGTHQTVPDVIGLDWPTAISTLGGFFNVTTIWSVGAAPGGVFFQMPTAGPTCDANVTLRSAAHIAVGPPMYAYPPGPPSGWSVDFDYIYTGPTAFQVERSISGSCNDMTYFFGMTPVQRSIMGGSTDPVYPPAQNTFRLSHPQNDTSQYVNSAEVPCGSGGWEATARWRAVATEMPGTEPWSWTSAPYTGTIP